MPRFLILSNPRSGSTLLKDLLNCHPEIDLEGELLNDEIQIDTSPLEFLENKLSIHAATFVGFKVFPEQIFQRDLDLASIVRQIGITQIIVLWRENILETLVSRRIAEESGIWYARNNSPAADEPTTHHKIRIEPQDLIEYTTEVIQDWNKIVDQWPLGISPIYVKFEDLIVNPMEQVKHILSNMGCPIDNNFTARSPSKRQNPNKLADKVENYYELPINFREGSLRLREIFSLKQIQQSVIGGLPKEVLPFAPNREPTVPSGGWRYRVAEPFITDAVKQNVYDAIESGSISSAGHWPRLMATKLKQFFQLPVAQPCCNGFTALMLAMQCANLKEGDEIIMPSLTMVAVPNSAHFIRARPIFADCAKNNYNPGWNEIFAVSGEKTRAVVVTHTYGVPSPDMEKIAEECRLRGWWLIEDISEAFGVTTTIQDGSTKLLGTFGNFACASLYVNKIIHAGDGGFIVAKDPTFAIRLTSLVNHGFTPSYHFVHFEPALNAKINGVGASIACGCIDEIDQVIQHRRWVAQKYRTALAPLPVKLMPSCGPHDTPWVFGIVCESKEERTRLRAHLANYGIETRDFFFALHLQPAYFKKYDKIRIQPRLPLSETLGSTGFYLPTHSNLTESDLHYITSCVISFFQKQDQNTVHAEIPALQNKKNKQSVQIQPGTFHVEIRTFNDSGSLNQTERRSHTYFDAVKLGVSAETTIIQERFDSKVELVSDMRDCIDRAKLLGLDMAKNMETFFKPYLEYFESQVNFEQDVEKPWLLEDPKLSSDPELALQLNLIPTTSDPETLQLLLHLIKKTRPETIWEIGCWMGHTTFLMAALCHSLSIRNKIFACDAFKWQKWMERFTGDLKNGQQQILPGDSFLKEFKNFLTKFSSSIQPVVWPYDIQTLPIELKNQRPDLIYLDITQEEEDLDIIWDLIKSNLIPNKTIILFNGLSYKSIPFFTKHADKLEGIAKPGTMAKAFLFRPQTTPCGVIMPKNLTRKLNFQSDPGWSHHHKNLFCSSIGKLRDRFHDPSAPILFFPAVEEQLCNEPDLFMQNPWIGIVHSVPLYPQQFYTPDLTRLCSQRYFPMMKNCKGLFTLTQLQAKFLQQNLPNMYTFPIQPLKYPVDQLQDLRPSTVPNSIKNGQVVDAVLVGSFARDFPFFFKTCLPEGFQKVMVAGDEEITKACASAPSHIKILPRLDDDEYENMLMQSVVFLCLLYDGAANTIVLECIARNVPIVCPNMESCVEYLGSDYPLLYDPKYADFEKLLTLQNIEAAIDYLEKMGKHQLTPGQMMDKFSRGVVLQSLPPVVDSSTELALSSKSISNFPTFDVTICICSYKRTHHLTNILKALWENQDFKGRLQIIVWNNNEGRTGIVTRICNQYIQQSNESKSLELISCTQNHFCSIRFTMPALMKSNSLLICDDDIIPGPNFVSFFLSAHTKHPRDVLCVRGHVFLPHQLDLDGPRSAWEDYESVRFKDDHTPEQLIHFVHADACLIPKEALREIASVEMPDQSFALVDDYWMSFILNHKFNRKLRKLCTAGLAHNPIHRTQDSDQIGLALHTRPEVREARLQLYIHHMIQNWPQFPTESTINLLSPDEIQLIKDSKTKFWDQAHTGFNVSSKLLEEDVFYLQKWGVKTVRIGAVGIGQDIGYDLCEFLTEPEKQIASLEETVKLLASHDITSVLTVDRRLASVEIWTLIASTFAQNASVVGYDLVNEPFTELENELHWLNLTTQQDSGVEEMVATYKALIHGIRKVDPVTPIVIEPSFWARCYALDKLPIHELKALDSNLLVSFHFYEPMILTQRYRNKGRFHYPGQVPVYDNTSESEEFLVDEKFIRERFEEVRQWGADNAVKVVLGEFGICRNIKGAEDYMGAGLKMCRDAGISAYIFSFRDHEWDAMNFELGPDPCNLEPIENKIMSEISKYIA